MLLWENFLQTLETNFGKGNVNKWLRPLTVTRFDACNIYLQADDPFQVLWIEEHVLPFAKETFRNNNGHVIKIHISLPFDKREKIETKSAPQDILEYRSDAVLSPLMIEQYVPTPQNKISYQIFCKLLGYNFEKGTLSDLPPEKFNPILVYGPTGCGKTHLLMAAATLFQIRGQKVFYVKGETFTDHVVHAIRSGNMKSFRAAYRENDVLIIDDVQIFGRKNATQEELFHTFNTLHTAGKQIILSANMNPRLLEYIEDRLISRFEWGITLPLEKPTELSILPEILNKRARFFNLQLKKNLSDYLLKHFQTPSLLTTALETLAQAHPTSKLIELNQVEASLTKLLEAEMKNSLTPDKILEAVAQAFGIKKEDILSKSQSRESTLPRQITMYLLRQQLKLPFMRIGDILHRDHSTVMSAIKQISKGIDTQNSEITYYLNQLRSHW